MRIERQKITILLFILIGVMHYPCLAQKIVVQRDTSSVLDTLAPISDTLLVPSLPKDSLSLPSNKGYKLSKDAISQAIDYSAQDSNVTDVKNKIITLYTKANATYQQTKIDAHIIVIDFDNNTAQGFSRKAKSGVIVEKGIFNDGTTKGTFDEMKVNFETNKAFVRNLKKQEGEFTIIGDKSKYLPAEADTVYGEAKFFNTGTTFSTCNLDHPHFAIRTSKAKMIPDKFAVLGPAQLEIADIPTPLVLPFGFLPLIKGQSSGLIFPNDYEYNDNYGFGLREIGYYFPINDYLDLKITGDIYTRGSHGLRLNSNYKKRYAYNGNVNLQYSNFIQENDEGNRISNISFSIGVTHNQDAKAHPYRRIGGNVNISTNRHNQRNFFDAQNALNNQYRSSFSYNYNFPESPFKLSVGLTHSQTVSNRQVNITLPDANLTMNTIQPFKQKNRTGDPAWYENINLSYGASLRNSVATTDTTLFTQQTIDDLVTGFSHNSTMSMNTRVAKYFTLTPSVSYREIYNLKSFERNLDPTLVVDTNFIDAENNIFELDTTFGTIKDQLVVDPNAYRSVNTSLSVNTQLFMTKLWSKGRIRGIRHIAKPSLDLVFAPGNRELYEQFVDTDTRAAFNQPLSYNPFPTQPFGASLSDKNFGINWRINNTIETKYFSKKDTTEKNIKIIENWTINGGYDFQKDSLKWSNIVLSGNSRLIKGLSTMTLRMNFSPYELDKNNRPINQLLWDTQRRPIQLSDFSLSFNSGISIKDLFDKILGTKTNQVLTQPTSAPTSNSARPAGVATGNTNTSLPLTEEIPSLRSIIENFRISHNLVFAYRKTISGDTLITQTHTMALNGNLKLTRNWSINLGHIGYDFKSKAFTYPSFTFSRDLHCWSMNFGWFPQSDVYTFYIGAKSSTLSFLKYDYGQNRFGPQSFGR